VDWPIHEIARLAGTTSRTLRHYGQLGLLEPSRVGANGYRYYDAAALTRLQRILLLRELGLGLPAIAEVLAGEADDAAALHTHLAWLRQEKRRLDRQIASVEETLMTMEGGEQLMAERMFDGFDNSVYKDEVEQRWGAEAYRSGTEWWNGKTAEERGGFARLNADWAHAAERDIDPAGAEAQALAVRQVEWLSGVPGTPADTRTYLLGLADMYVADERFAANYGGVAGAAFVAQALREYVRALG
jgi:MerR family transcriptional regulator, thiopeptide resistance regulator